MAGGGVGQELAQDILLPEAENQTKSDWTESESYFSTSGTLFNEIF